MQHRAKKSLGQNFLKSKSALSAMVSAGDINAGDIVLEIGPGKGALTERMLLFAGKVIAIEKDDVLIPLLKEKFAKEIKSGKLDLIHRDALEFDPEVLKFYEHSYKLIANIPYYITGAIFKKFLEETTHQPETIVLLVQKEVSDRIVARDGKESILSISVKAYGTPKYIKKIPARDFSPAPKVDSAIIAIENISKKNFKDISEKRFFEILKTGFAHKRKVLIKNLEVLFEREKLTEVFTKESPLGISEKSRAEELSIESWLSLVKELS
ncbi:MAG: 16S rRNA (adenine(1518)-N(6)/adenine(1519)-N(6))-dimethyltransferase RsmA [Candidatus Paceibacterota bacterium]|jgi:16S rRNA (adenine1518-N6/adenine1519-N6)-dimethyltransferase